MDIHICLLITPNAIGVNLDRLVNLLHCLFLLYFSCTKSKKKQQISLTVYHFQTTPLPLSPPLVVLPTTARWLVVILCAFLFRSFLTDIDTNTMNAGGAAMYIPSKDEWHCSPYCSVALIIDLFHCTEIPDMVVDCLCGTLGSISFSIAIAFCIYSTDFVT